MESLKILVQEYGKLTIITHGVLSLGFFIGIYFLIARKYIDPWKLLKKLGVDPNSQYLTTAGDITIAYVIYKSTMIARIPFTLALVPFLARYLKIK